MSQPSTILRPCVATPARAFICGLLLSAIVTAVLLMFIWRRGHRNYHYPIVNGQPLRVSDVDNETWVIRGGQWVKASQQHVLFDVAPADLAKISVSFDSWHSGSHPPAADIIVVNQTPRRLDSITLAFVTEKDHEYAAIVPVDLLPGATADVTALVPAASSTLLFSHGTQTKLIAAKYSANDPIPADILKLAQ